MENMLSLLFIPQRRENMVSVVPSRTGRHLQRYDKNGYRQVVGCVPYRYRKSNESCSSEEVEVLMVSSQKGQGMLLPKGGWENDESMEDAALRETEEEAGVKGNVGDRLGSWCYQSKRQAIMHEGYMFPLLVTKELDCWPERNVRKRQWMTVAEAKEVCQCSWMKDVLEEFSKKMQSQRKEEAQKRVLANL